MDRSIYHYRVLTGVFIIIEYGLEYYTEVQDLSYLLEHVSDDPLMIKYKKLTGALIGIVEDYSLVNYMTLNVEVCFVCLLSLTTICSILIYVPCDLCEKISVEAGNT